MIEVPHNPGATAPGAAPAGWRSLVAVIACVSVFDVTLGLTYPLLSLTLEARGVDAATNGLNAAMMPLGLILTAPLTPLLARRFGTWRYATSCILATALLLALLKLLPDLGAWFVLRFLLGIACGGLFAISEAWINELANGRNRGRVVALYSSLLSAGFCAGPLILVFTGIEGWTPFAIGILFALCGLLPLVLVRRSIPAPQQDSASLLSFLPLAPTLLLAVAVFAILDSATLSLLPLYGLRSGYDEAAAAFMVVVLVGGNIGLQFPIGWLADRWSRRPVMIACAGITAVSCLLLPVTLHSFLVWPLLLLLGSAAFGVYTMAMAELGDRFSGALLLAGTAAFAAMWGLGGMAGPPLAGLAMEWQGPDGLPWFMAAVFLLMTLTATWRALKADRRGA
jgi:MFS family permease